MPRYWRVDRGNGILSFAVSEGDLSSVLAGATELTQQEHTDQSATQMALSASPDPVITTLVGNKMSYSTATEAKKVTIQVNSPTGGPLRARPLLDGQRVTKGVYTFVYPGKSKKVQTRAGNNDIVIIEVF